MTTRFRRMMPVAVALLVGIVIGAWAVERVSARKDLYSYLDLFNDALAKIEGAYVEDVDSKELLYGAIRGMLTTLDPYSAFLDEDSYRDFQVTTEGEFGGLGIQITVRDGILTVVSPIEGTPAFDLGISSGDRIVAIEGEPTRGITVDEAIKKLRGDPGTKVNITISREGIEDLLEYTVTRDVIKIDSVPYAFLLRDGVGYVRVSRFSRTSAEELREKLDELESEGMTKLVLDVRSNPGGLLTQAVDVSDIFLDTGELIVSTKGRLKDQNKDYYAPTPARFSKDFPIVVLVNGGSASASEILAGSIQDWDRGVVVGTPSFGKGSVQTLMRLRPFTKDCAMKLTTAKWYTSSGRLIEKPERWPSADDEVALSEGEPAEEKPEYLTAGKRIVYGGGGITPDVTVETQRRADIIVDLERREEFFEFAIEYAADNDVDAVGLEVGEQLWGEFVDFLTRDGFEFDEEELLANRAAAELRIRRDLTRRILGREEAYVVAVEGDEQVAMAVDLAVQAGSLNDLFALAEDYAQMEEE
jgi:carboxyl-terminal processing protease